MAANDPTSPARSEQACDDDMLERLLGLSGIADCLAHSASDLGAGPNLCSALARFAEDFADAMSEVQDRAWRIEGEPPAGSAPATVSV